MYILLLNVLLCRISFIYYLRIQCLNDFNRCILVYISLLHVIWQIFILVILKNIKNVVLFIALPSALATFKVHKINYKNIFYIYNDHLACHRFKNNEIYPNLFSFQEERVFFCFFEYLVMKDMWQNRQVIAFMKPRPHTHLQV